MSGHTGNALRLPGPFDLNIVFRLQGLVTRDQVIDVRQLALEDHNRIKAGIFPDKRPELLKCLTLVNHVILISDQHALIVVDTEIPIPSRLELLHDEI